jgi:hypothetical protein
MDYAYSFLKKRGYGSDTKKACYSLMGLFEFLLLMLTTLPFTADILAFETNVGSKVDADLSVTGKLEVGSVGDSKGIVTSVEGISSNSDDTTIPTTKAVKSYLDKKILYYKGDYLHSYANHHCIDKEQSRLPAINELMDFCVTGCNEMYWTHMPGLAEGEYIAFNPKTTEWRSGNATATHRFVCVK